MRYVIPQILSVSDPSSEINGNPTQKQIGSADSPDQESPVAAYEADE